jgi:hypothetical protein
VGVDSLKPPVETPVIAVARTKKPMTVIRLSMTDSLVCWLRMTQARQLLEPNVVERRAQQPLHQGKTAAFRDFVRGNRY